MRGDGSLFRRGSVWWMKFYREGRAFRLPCHTTNKTVAGNMLREEVQKSRGLTWLAPDKRDVSIGELVNDLFAWYRAQGKDDMARASEAKWKMHAEPMFGRFRADALTTTMQREYRSGRLAEGAAQATINRELQTMRRAYKLALNAEPPKVLRAPAFEMVREDNARKVFVNQETADKLRSAAASRGLWQRIFLEIGLTYGWRRSEIAGLRNRDVDLMENLIRLDTSKNGEPREVPMIEPIRTLLRGHLMTTGTKPDELLFPLAEYNWQYEWAKICAAAGVKPGKKDGGIIFHDLRRSSARNKRAAGVATSVIMQMQGWKSEAMFRRYAIVDRSDIARALTLEAENRHSTGTIPPQVLES